MLIITQKIFNDPHVLSHKEVMGMLDGINKDREMSTGISDHKGNFIGMKPHEITATGKSDPRMRDEKIAADKKHDQQEAMDQVIEDLKANNWKINIPSSKKAEPEKTPTSSKEVTVKVSKAPEVVETAPVESDSDDKKGMSFGAKAGLAALGAAAGYGAYRAWKKRKAKKSAVDAEVDEFLQNKYKTEE
jgi:hypothetical protein